MSEFRPIFTIGKFFVVLCTPLKEIKIKIKTKTKTKNTNMEVNFATFTICLVAIETPISLIHQKATRASLKPSKS